MDLYGENMKVPVVSLNYSINDI